ncbi:glycosyl hydrolase 115 family protein [uncultured Prevotella sp.]|uniref:glycosyl hydrolase 115 family protein n=1 Tax=uncultured Prevotella sp. TaxID=159272 RepID=UPI00261E3930|nr:glycosyl hydrolase 115 family protein [uncultured Prevotella sp.]
MINYIKLKMLVIASLLMSVGQAEALEWKSGKTITLVCDTASMEPVARTASLMLKGDIKTVLDADIKIIRGGKPKGSSIYANVNAAAFAYKKEAFKIETIDNTVRILGSDAHGIAYALLEISRMLGVSPWEWWADSKPRPLERFSLNDNYKTKQAPSVEFRGIFINDEDWGLMPWASKTYEPTDVKGQIGPNTNARIFELLLRLRANTYWPAMHECSRPFFLTKGNREVALRYGIYIGGSHCEPMASSTATEWKIRGKGEYDYVNNSTNVSKFWEDRVKEVAKQPILYTLGMRGVHDGAMQGAKTVEEQKRVLEKAIKDQRELLARYVDRDVTHVPQLFIPYKEVLDVYNAGLEVPDDVCLVWCDDNYGYVRHFPNQKERMRKGGNGIYYHVSYWGRPHDYLWLGSFSPSLMFQQMSQAWHKGIQRFWILNVGDIKPAEYQIELFLDMAWQMQSIYPGQNDASRELIPNDEWLATHLHNFYTREFGQETGNKILPLMLDSYRLAFIRKPEFLGNTRCEEWDKKYSIISDLPWSEEFIRSRLAEYKMLADKADAVSKSIPVERKDKFFQLVEYPLKAAEQMNDKLLYAQLARHGKADWERSDAAYDSIVALTRRYNEGFYNNGKWNRIMDFEPRKQPVFNRVPHTVATTPLPTAPHYIAKLNATDCYSGTPIPWVGLGYEGKAAGICKGEELCFHFNTENASDSLTIEVRMIPTHPMNSGKLRFAISLDGSEPVTAEYQTEGRSEEWKVNTLRNHAVRTFRMRTNRQTISHIIRIKAIDDGVVLDQVFVY